MGNENWDVTCPRLSTVLCMLILHTLFFCSTLLLRSFGHITWFIHTQFDPRNYPVSYCRLGENDWPKVTQNVRIWTCFSLITWHCTGCFLIILGCINNSSVNEQDCETISCVKCVILLGISHAERWQTVQVCRCQYQVFKGSEWQLWLFQP